jgi:hypothetical protein
MTDSIKAACLFLLISCAGLLAVVWADDQPGQTTWALRIGGSVVAGLAIIALFIPNRSDIAPDYLFRVAGNEFFDRDGFCFAFSAKAIDNLCHFEAYFQNRYDRPCTGRIALRPLEHLFANDEFEAITYEIECAPGAFGVARIPVPVPPSAQGKARTFQIGAAVVYPSGRGKALRFRSGMFLRTNEKFHDGFATALMVGGALTGMLAWQSPATVTITMPEGIAADTSHKKPEVLTFWKLGDPPLLISNTTTSAEAG